jgi:hypothetical protein
MFTRTGWLGWLMQVLRCVRQQFVFTAQTEVLVIIC